MLQHILVMNALVPIAAFWASRRLRFGALWRGWPWATAAQIALLWGWHSPGVLPLAAGSAGLMLAMHFSLALAAFWFWLAIASMPRDGSWRAIFALLVTGKLFCLLGALLVFAPNVLFDFGGAHLHHGMAGATGLADQQAAGILMLIACPLTYVGAGVLIAGRWFLGLEADAARHG